MTFTEKHKQNLSISATKRTKGKIIQSLPDGTFVNEWHSTTYASKATGIDASSISKCIKGKLRTTGGYTWKRI